MALAEIHEMSADERKLQIGLFILLKHGGIPSDGFDENTAIRTVVVPAKVTSEIDFTKLIRFGWDFDPTSGFWEFEYEIEDGEYELENDGEL